MGNNWKFVHRLRSLVTLAHKKILFSNLLVHTMGLLYFQMVKFGTYMYEQYHVIILIVIAIQQRLFILHIHSMNYLWL